MFTGLQLRKSEQNDFHALFSFLNKTQWCDPHWNRFFETISMSGRIIGFGWDIRKLVCWKLSILILICCPGSIVCLYALVFALGVLCRVLQFLIDSTPLWPNTTVFGSLLFFCLGFSSLSTSGQALIFIETETDTRDPTVLPSLSQNRPICSFKCLVYSTNTPYTTKRAYLCI